ncbi:MAG TPA: helix-turn-helix transcriptional regulator [Methylomirabilota bacterium]|nr:helix-turn-helix transcriptional regulator [Methylomirabilota bacterium]
MRLRLREWRLQRGHSLRSLAAKAGVSYVTVVRIEQGTMSPTVDMLAKLARALKVHITDFFPPKRKTEDT